VMRRRRSPVLWPLLLLSGAAAPASCDEQCLGASPVLVQRAAVLTSGRGLAAPPSTEDLHRIPDAPVPPHAGDARAWRPILLQQLTLRRHLDANITYVLLLFLAMGSVLMAVLVLCVNQDAQFGPKQQVQRPRRQPQPQQQQPEQRYERQPASAAAVGAYPPRRSQWDSRRSAASARSLQVPSLLPMSAAPSLAPSVASLQPPAARPPTSGQGIRYTFGGSVCAEAREIPADAAPPPPSARPSSIGGQSDDGAFPSARKPGERALCPCLVVPDGMELVFAVRDLLTRKRQQVSFSVVDLEGTPLSHVIVNEVGPQCGIHLQMLDRTPLAWVRTEAVHERGGLPEICFPSGEVFCTVAREDAVLTGRYTLRGTAGQLLYTFHGDFREKALNVVSSSGRLVCDTERCELGYDSSPHYQVRIAPFMDAGLILCGLLAVEKLEGSMATPRQGSMPL